MIDNGMFMAWMCSIFAVALFGWPHRFAVAASTEQVENCITAAVERTNTIKALPAKTHLQTLDGKMVPLNHFSHLAMRCFHGVGCLKNFTIGKVK